MLELCPATVIRDHLRIGLGTLGSATTVLRLYDLTGRVVAARRYGLTDAGAPETTCDFSDLAPGIYILELRTAHHRATRRLTVSH
ncbi:MAG: T9SS type A sorting domain-containing protein [candidate division WOR-3 bacterium]